MKLQRVIPQHPLWNDQCGPGRVVALEDASRFPSPVCERNLRAITARRTVEEVAVRMSDQDMIELDPADLDAEAVGAELTVADYALLAALGVVVPALLLIWGWV